MLYAIGAGCYYGIDAAGSLAFWKYINPYALLKSGDIIGKYRNLNVFDIPYSYLFVFFMIAVMLIGIFGYAGVIQFDIQREGELVSGRKQGKTYVFLARTNRLFFHEAYKLFLNGKLLFIILGYCVYIFVSSKPVTEDFYFTRDTYYDAYIDFLKGPVSEEKEEFLELETKRFEKLETQFESKEDSGYYEHMLQPYMAFVKIRDVTTNYLKEVDGEYLHETGYLLLTGDVISNNKDIKLGLLAAMILIFPLSYIYGIEYQKNTIVLLNTTCYGRKRTFFVKILMGMFTVMIVYLLTYAPFYYSVFSFFGTESIYAPACSLQNLTNIPHNISILQYLIFVGILRYIGLLLLMLGLFYTSSKIKSVIGTCLVAVLLVILPLVFAYLQIPGASYLLLNPFIIGNVF